METNRVKFDTCDKNNNNNQNNNQNNDENNNQNNKYLNKLQINKIKKLLICSICRDILYEPTTLYCQHTFCNNCLEKIEENSMVECPLCHHKGLIIPSHNYKIKEVIEKIFTKDELTLRQERYNKHKTFSTIDKEIKRKIRNEVWYNEINKDKSKNNNNNQIGDNFFFPLNL
jgi:hypothetical protein